MMRKKLYLLCSVILLAGCLLITSFASEKIGDVNDDGRITAADARLVLRHSASLELLPDSVLANADADGNGRITAADARLILRVSANLDSFKEKNPTLEPTTKYSVTTEKSTSAQAEASAEEILAKYTEVLDLYKKNVTIYEKKEYQELIARDFGSHMLDNVADGLFNDFLTPELKAEIQRRYDYEEIPVIGNERGCLLTDVSALKSASMSVDNGQTTITLVFNDEKNPKKADPNAVQVAGYIGAVFNPITQDEIIAAFGDSQSFGVNKCDLLYHDCTATLVFDSESLKLVSLRQVMNIDIDMNIKLAVVNRACSFALKNVMWIQNVK